MDGNGRWAAQRHLPGSKDTAPASTRSATAVETSARMGIAVLTLYAFSVENWKRPRAEVSTLMVLLQALPALRAEHAARARHPLPRHRPDGGAVARHPEGAVGGSARTAANTGMLFNIALNYGGRAEIVDAARRAIAAGIKPDELDEERFAGCSTRPASPIPIS